MKQIKMFTGKYDFLSNFHESPILFPNGKIAPTVEHAFQAAKAFDVQEQNFILNAPSPSKAKYYGRSCVLRSDWEKIKREVMRHYVTLKFLTHNDLAEKLLDTNNVELIEGNTWGDTYWGKVDDIGDNHLGKILMAVRYDLNKNYTKTLTLWQ